MSSPESFHQPHDSAPTVPLHAVPNYPPHEWLQPGQPESAPTPLQPQEQGHQDQPDYDHIEPTHDANVEPKAEAVPKGVLHALGHKVVGMAQKVNDYTFDPDTHPKFIEKIDETKGSQSGAHTTAKQKLPKLASYLSAWAGVDTSEVPSAGKSGSYAGGRERASTLSTEAAVDRMEHQHYVRVAPRFENLLRDTSRTNTFKYIANHYATGGKDPGMGSKVIEMTEHQGLNELHNFLSDYLKYMIKKGNGDTPTAREAKGMLDNLTFIGDKEYKEGAEGLGDLWKAYLNANPKNQLCIPNKISQNGGKRKSDVYLFENILASFSDEELKQYSGRIVTSLNEITEKPKNVRIVLLDDWTISGSQMQSAYNSIRSSSKFRSYADRVEVNLVVGSKNRLEKGLRVGGGWNGEETRIPVKAYFKAHDAGTTSRYDHRAHVTGTHSSVDYDFENDINTMLDQFNSSLHKRHMPPLTNIVRPYRHATPKVSILPGGRIIRNKV